MIYLIDDLRIPVPKDCERLVYVGLRDEERLDIEQLTIEERAMLDLGAKVQFWHQRNGFVDFRVLTQDQSKYGKYVSSRHFD